MITYRKKIESYLEDKAVPIVEEHKTELADLIVTVTNRLSKSDEVKKKFPKNVQECVFR